MIDVFDNAAIFIEYNLTNAFYCKRVFAEKFESAGETPAEITNIFLAYDVIYAECWRFDLFKHSLENCPHCSLANDIVKGIFKMDVFQGKCRKPVQAFGAEGFIKPCIFLAWVGSHELTIRRVSQK